MVFRVCWSDIDKEWLGCWLCCTDYDSVFAICACGYAKVSVHVYRLHPLPQRVGSYRCGGGQQHGWTAYCHTMQPVIVVAEHLDGLAFSVAGGQWAGPAASGQCLTGGGDCSGLCPERIPIRSTLYDAAGDVDFEERLQRDWVSSLPVRYYTRYLELKLTLRTQPAKMVSGGMRCIKYLLFVFNLIFFVSIDLFSVSPGCLPALLIVCVRWCNDALRR